MLSSSVELGEADWPAIGRAVARVETGLLGDRRRRLDPELAEALGCLVGLARSGLEVAEEVLGEAGAYGEAGAAPVTASRASRREPALAVPAKAWTEAGDPADPAGILAAVVEVNRARCVAIAFEMERRDGVLGARQGGRAFERIRGTAGADGDPETIFVSGREYAVVVVPATGELTWC